MKGTKNMGDNLTVVDIANLCLMSKKYKKEMQEAGLVNNMQNEEEFLQKCSESISEQLKIMDECQRLLYKNGYKETNVEEMKKVKDVFQKGIDTMQQVLESFSIVTNE